MSEHVQTPYKPTLAECIDSVRLHGIKYSVTFCQDTVGHDYMGYVLHHERTISLDAHFPEITQATTLLHEIVHAIRKLDETENPNDDIDEKETRMLAHSLYDLIVNNPELIRAIQATQPSQ
jgi:hypothetical protein